MSVAGKPRGPYVPWLPEDLALARKAMGEGYGPAALQELFPGRSPQALRNVYQRINRELYGRTGQKEAERAVKAPGDYVETLACYLVEDEECMRIWLDWNGYSKCRKLSRDRRGWVTLLCTAK
jgi:hypothetical protein